MSNGSVWLRCNVKITSGVKESTTQPTSGIYPPGSVVYTKYCNKGMNIIQYKALLYSHVHLECLRFLKSTWMLIFCFGRGARLVDLSLFRSNSWALLSMWGSMGQRGFYLPINSLEVNNMTALSTLYSLNKGTRSHSKEDFEVQSLTLLAVVIFSCF